MFRRKSLQFGGWNVNPQECEQYRLLRPIETICTSFLERLDLHCSAPAQAHIFMSLPAQKWPLGCVIEATKTKTTMNFIERGAVSVPSATGN